MKLDVGCSDAPQGDVNVDFRTTELRDVYKTPLQTYRQIKNFVKADAQHLPFRAKIFSQSVSSHTIEHVAEPSLMIHEMKRVTKGIIKIITPFWFSYAYFSWLRHVDHKYWFMPSWFKRLGFKTSVNLKLLRPELLGKKAPFYFPFFEIVADVLLHA